MSDNVAAEVPDVEFVRPCNLCPHMKRITLENILQSLELMRYEVTIPEDIAAPARRAVQRMVDVHVTGRDYGGGMAPEVVVEDRASVDPAAAS